MLLIQTYSFDIINTQQLKNILLVFAIFNIIRWIARKVKAIIRRKISKNYTNFAKNMRPKIYRYIKKQLRLFWYRIRRIIVKDVITAFYYLRKRIVLRIPFPIKKFILQFAVLFSYTFIAYYLWVFPFKLFSAITVIVLTKTFFKLPLYLCPKLKNGALALLLFLQAWLTNVLCDASVQYYSKWLLYMFFSSM